MAAPCVSAVLLREGDDCGASPATGLPCPPQWIHVSHYAMGAEVPVAVRQRPQAVGNLFGCTDREAACETWAASGEPQQAECGGRSAWDCLSAGLWGDGVMGGSRACLPAEGACMWLHERAAWGPLDQQG